MRLANRFPRASAITLALAMVSAAGCARAPVPMPEFVKPYRMTIQQGNFVTREMVEQLKPGMTKEQVRFILGTPLLTDIFHADRWDYTFYRDVPGAKREQRNFSVIFEDQKLARVIGDLLPGEPTAPVARPAPAKPAAGDAPKPVAPAPAKEERGFFGRLFAPSAAEAPPEEQKQQQGQNWGTAEPAKEPAPAPAPPKAEAEPEQKQEQAKPAAERGFFGRMLEKIGF